MGVPFERIAMDLAGPLPQTDRGNVYILVIFDYFTKYVEAFALPDQRAPRELHTDLGANF